MKRLTTGRRFTVPFILALLPFLMGNEANATVITVTSTGDTIAVDGFVTLREAITASNTDAVSGDAPAGSGVDSIEFNIAGAPGTVFTIQPTSALPTITDPVVINGYTQAGATQNTLVNGDNAFIAIELDGTNAGAAPGLEITAGSTTIQGLVINRFAQEGIRISGAGSNVIQGNFIGVDQTGTLDRGNGSNGIAISSSNNLIGGTMPNARNVISGDDLNGIFLSGLGVSGNRIQGNYIGTSKNGATGIANTGSGIYLQDVSSTSIGSALSGSANIIAFNGGAGVLLDVSASTGNLILGNSIFSNGGLGIDLNNDGVTANDNLDADVGPNGLQNYPVITSAVVNKFGLTIHGTLASAPSTTYRLEFFANTVADPTGYGEGERYIGSVDVTTNAGGDASFEFHTSTKQNVGTQISSTATDSNNNTSEFSAVFSVVYHASDDDDDHEGDDEFFDDDEFDVAPFPFLPGYPVGPVPPVAAGPVAPVDEVVATKPEESVMVDDKKEVKVDEKADTSMMENAPSISTEEISIKPKPKRVKEEQASGCSTVANPSWSILLTLALLGLRLRLRKRAQKAS